MTGRIGLWPCVVVLGLAGCGSCGDSEEQKRPAWLQPTAGSKRQPKLEVSPESLSTDEGVIEAYERATGDELGGRCIERPNELAGIVLVGAFAHDRGCIPKAVFVDGTYHPAEEATAPALAHLGWNEPDADRKALALAWLREGWLAHRGDWQQHRSPLFDVEGASTFHEPEAELRDGGAVVVRVWVQEPRGRSPSRSFTRMAYRLGPDGQLEVRVLDAFKAPP